jgi:hypothetical protein
VEFFINLKFFLKINFKNQPNHEKKASRRVKIKYNEFIKSTGLGKHFGWLDVKLTHSVGFCQAS